MHDLAGGEVRLDVPALPAPLHLAKALGSARGLGMRDRLIAVAFTRWLQKRHFDLPDTPLGTLLDDHRQSPRLVRALWEPLCLATLNTPYREASARLFARVLGESFTGSRHNCDLLWPRQSLGRLLPDRGVDYLVGRGGTLLAGRRVTALESRDERIEALRLDDGQRLAVDALVLAVPLTAARSLLAGHRALEPIATLLAGIGHEPIATVYLRYPRPVTIDGTLRGVLGGVTQWLVDRRDCGTRDLIAAVISASGNHETLDRAALAARVTAEAARVFPGWPAPVEQWVIREKRATFASRAGVEALRPAAGTPLHGCWLAGDWTATGLPGTLEGAVASGLEAARQVAGSVERR
jgi:squalene-associated FAD-dependent desaturase